MLTRETIQKVIDLKAEKHSNISIAEKLGVHRTTIAHILKTETEPIPRPEIKPEIKILDAKIIEMIKEPYGITEDVTLSGQENSIKTMVQIVHSLEKDGREKTFIESSLIKKVNELFALREETKEEIIKQTWDEANAFFHNDFKTFEKNLQQLYSVELTKQLNEKQQEITAKNIEIKNLRQDYNQTIDRNAYLQTENQELIHALRNRSTLLIAPRDNESFDPKYLWR